MTTALDQLARLVPPPTLASSPDWAAVEAQAGTALPDDYKRLVDKYGPGTFDQFLAPMLPKGSNENLDLLAQWYKQLWALRMLHAKGEPTPYRLDEADPVLMPWAITANGDVCYWVREPPDEPTSWRVAVNEARGPEWQEFPGSATEFLVAVLSGSFVCEIFPENFPSGHPSFVPWQGVAR